MEKINKICKKCNIMESNKCVFDLKRRVCRMCRYESKRNVDYFTNYYKINKTKILLLKSTNYKIKKNELVL